MVRWILPILGSHLLLAPTWFTGWLNRWVSKNINDIFKSIDSESQVWWHLPIIFQHLGKDRRIMNRGPSWTIQPIQVWPKLSSKTVSQNNEGLNYSLALEKLLSICKAVFRTTAPTPQRHTQKSRQGAKGAAKATYVAVCIGNAYITNHTA